MAMEFLNDPTFWVLVAFMIFVVLATKPIYGLISDGLDKRADKIRNDLEEAENLRKEAQDLLASYQRKQREVIDEAEEIRQQAIAEADKLLNQGRKSLEESIERRRKLALERIAHAEIQAIDTVRAKTIDTAINITREYLINDLKGKKANELVDTAIKELPNKLH